MIAWLLCAALAAAPAAPDAGALPPWTKVADGRVQVFSRRAPGVRVAELKAQMIMAVTPLEVRAVLLDDDYTRREPYVGEYKTVAQLGPSEWIHYTRLALPVVSDRDYFIDITRVHDLAPDGSGEYLTTWVPWAVKQPEKSGVVRVTTNSGHWLVKATPDGAHAFVEYYLSFDSGGWLPAWVVNRGNKSVLPDVLNALEKEALRRRAAQADAKAQAKK